MPEDDVTCIRKARSLAEAFPEFYEALRDITEAHARIVWNGEMNGNVAHCRAILKRMSGDTETRLSEGDPSP